VRGGGERGDGRDWSAMNRGDWRPELGGQRAPDQLPGALGGRLDSEERMLREGARDLSQLRQQLADNPEVSADVQRLVREMQQLDPSKFPGNPELVERLRNQVLAGLEQLELQLRRKLDEQNSGQVRAGSSVPVPQGYQESVAEYFRRLSRGGK
jgi:hypothetical protein